MGLSNHSNVQKIFLNVIGGKMCRKVNKDTEGAISRINKNNETIYELQYSSLTAKLKSIAIRESEFGKNWEVLLEDVGEQYTLQLPISGRVTNGFLFRLPNVDLSKEIEVVTFLDKEKENRSVLILKQDGQTVKQHYTKDAPNGLPQLKKVVFKNKEDWDDTEQQLFIKNMVENEIVPKLKQSTPAQFPPSVEPQSDDSNNAQDDLPF